MTFPGSRTFKTRDELVRWSATRYQSIAKSYTGFDELMKDDEAVVYCYGTLSGTWLDGNTFADIRFIDQFHLRGQLLRKQSVWNDLSETLLNSR